MQVSLLQVRAAEQRSRSMLQRERIRIGRLPAIKQAGEICHVCLAGHRLTLHPMNKAGAAAPTLTLCNNPYHKGEAPRAWLSPS